MLVRTIMSTPAVTTDQDCQVGQALELMKTKHVNHLPIVNRNGGLAGLVSESDLLKVYPRRNLNTYELNLLSRTPVKVVMDHNPHTIGADAPIEEAAHTMEQYKVVCLPVIDAGKVIGLVCDNDVLRSFLGVLGIGQPGLRLTVRFQRKKGFLAGLVRLFDENNAIIDKMVTFQHELVIKVQTDDPDGLRKALEAEGYQVLHFAEVPTLLACSPRVTDEPLDLLG